MGLISNLSAFEKALYRQDFVSGTVQAGPHTIAISDLPDAPARSAAAAISAVPATQQAPMSTSVPA